MSNETKIIAAYGAAKEKATELGPGVYTLDDILQDNAAWAALPWQNKGAVGDRFRKAVKDGDIAGMTIGGEDPATGDREYKKV